MLKRGFPVVAASALVLMLASAGSGRAQVVGAWGRWVYVPDDIAVPYAASTATYPGYPFGYVSSGVAVDPARSVSFYPPVFPPNTPAAARAPERVVDWPATIEVLVPPGTVLLFNGHRTLQTGAYRRFTTPPLEKNNAYHYTVEAVLNRNGREVTETRRIEVSAGARKSITIPLAK